MSGTHARAQGLTLRVDMALTMNQGSRGGRRERGTRQSKGPKAKMKPPWQPPFLTPFATPFPNPPW